MAARVPLRLITDCLVDYGLGVAQKRECGECDACCRVMAVKSLGKPPSCRCEYQNGHGCAVYADRPKDCQDYLCCWLTGFLDEEDRPDKSGLLLSVERGDHDRALLEVFETRPGALKARFPDLKDLLRLVMPVDEVGTPWTVVIVPYGTPRAMPDNVPVADTYAWMPILIGENVSYGNRRIQEALGVKEDSGILHIAGGGTADRDQVRRLMRGIEDRWLEAGIARVVSAWDDTRKMSLIKE
jgi:hypothetical protein